MSFDPQLLRLDGIYQQKGDDRFMQRVKIPAGALAAEQAFKLAELAERFAGSRVHLTSRGSIEFHDLRSADLEPVNQGMASVGLTGRGACGGAVRGISCATSFSEHYPACQALARRLHRHFAGNPYFEGLPKKFKISVEGDDTLGRQLIQDIGLVHAGEKDGKPLWDLWCAGGLGREPQPGFLFANRIPEARLLPLMAAIISVYKEQTPKGKRLKHLLREIGELKFRDLVRKATGECPPEQINNGLGQTLAQPTDVAPLIARVFAGELPAVDLRRLATLAAKHAGGSLLLTADQDIAFFPTSTAAAAQLRSELDQAGFADDQPSCRICPGNHDCAMGLIPTRVLAQRLLQQCAADLNGQSIAISGCPNSCSQPQLARFGIIPTKLLKQEDGSRRPSYDLYLREGSGFGQPVASGLDESGLLQALAAQLGQS